MMEEKKGEYKILFVCLGNICRSPSAEAVMKKLVQDAGLDGRIKIDSAGIIGYHAGENFDLIIGMDNRNIDDLKRKAPDLESVEKIHQMTEYSQNKLYDHVPDPYYSGAEGFELVLDLLEDACAGLLDELVQFISSNPDN